MPRRRVYATKRKRYTRRRKYGSNIFKKAWSGIKSIARPAWNFVKDNKLISKGLNLIPHPYGKIAGNVASQVGLGRRRRYTKRRKQGGCRMGGGALVQRRVNILF